MLYTTRRLILWETVASILSFITVGYYWAHGGGFLAVGIVLTLQPTISAVNTVMWYERTKQYGPRTTNGEGG